MRQLFQLLFIWLFSVNCSQERNNITNHQLIDTVSLDLSTSLVSWIYLESTPVLNGTIPIEKGTFLLSADTVLGMDILINMKEMEFQKLRKNNQDSIFVKMKKRIGYSNANPYLHIKGSSDSYNYQYSDTINLQLSIKSNTIDRLLPTSMIRQQKDDKAQFHGRIILPLIRQDSTHILDLALFLILNK